MNQQSSKARSAFNPHQPERFELSTLSTGPALAAYYLVLIYIFTIPWENALVIPGVGTISRAVGMLLVVVWAFSVLTQGSLGRINNVHKWASLFVFWCVLSIVWSSDYDIALIQAKTFAQLFVSLCIILSVISTPKRSVYSLQAFVLGCWVVALFVIYNYQIGNVTRWTQRASISGADENDIALVLGTGLPMAWFLSTRLTEIKKNKLFVLLNFIYMPVVLIAIIMTGSRGGFSAMLPTALFVLFGIKKLSLKSKMFATIALTIAIFLVIAYVPETPFRRIAETLDQVNNRTVSGRWDIWMVGLEVWAGNNFNSIFGLGVGGYSAEVGRVAHSTPISVLVETGVIGFVFFAAIVGSLIRQALKADRSVTWLCLTVLLVWFIGINALSWEYRKPTWVLWSLVACLASTHTTRRSRRTRSRHQRLGSTYSHE